METNTLKRCGAKDIHFAQAQQASLALGRVISQSHGEYTLLTEDGEILLSVTGKFRHEAENPACFPIAGDWVLLSPRGIERLLPRETFLARMAAGPVPYVQPIAANMDVCFVCMALDSGYNPAKLERFLSAAEKSGARVVTVLTKADLCADLNGALGAARALCPGADVIACTCETKDGFDAARAYMKEGVTAVLVGASGAGKSTLINALLGADALETQAVRRDGKGRHTTTRRELILLPSGGLVIDTPGMRSLALEESDVGAVFPEMEELASQCRFRDCTHTHEPGCAVQGALARGEIDARRYKSYLKLMEEQKRRARRRR